MREKAHGDVMEEKDLFQGSVKKIEDEGARQGFAGSQTGLVNYGDLELLKEREDDTMELREKDMEMGEVSQPVEGAKESYKAELLGSNADSRKTDNENEEEEDYDEVDDDDMMVVGGVQVTNSEEFPHKKLVHIPENLREKNYKPWSMSLIVKLLVPNFELEVVTIDKTDMWVQLRGISMELYHKLLLKVLGNCIGKVLKVDYKTIAKARGQFARLCVKVNLTKPLVSQLDNDGRMIYIEYKGLHEICFSCGTYGHM
ncbi:hypothetical protein L6164_023625 [Bauhinia variegata]|uniref:Uncharacterized protein n=1 Tax=Bauhinia variegata TaxID=167791 RepID=A0ACB9MJD4_BAUVA|nr:hypothetical protein L6164_023625 [Bauhinia variegata]